MRKLSRSQRRARSIAPLELKVTKLSHDGRGIAHHEGKVVFVDQALPEEVVIAELLEVRSSFATAKVIGIQAPSSSRIPAFCEVFERCGGCSMQHLDTAAQLVFKESVVHEKLTHNIPDNYTRLPVITSEAYGYRRKARLGVRAVAKKERVLVGFRERNSSFITDMKTCPVLHPLAAQLITPLSELIGSLSSAAQIPQIEIAVGELIENTDQVSIVVRHLVPLTSSDDEKLICFANKYQASHKLEVYLQPKGADSVYRFYPQEGKERLYYHLPEHNLRLAFHPMDFTQVNSQVNRQMVNRVVALLNPQPGERILDLFCGLGNFTLALAQKATEVVGVELSNEMVERGYENASSNGLDNCQFIAADLTLPEAGSLPIFKGCFDKILLDPPRSGALNILPALVKLNPSCILYVSCNPQTLARDVEWLCSHGYQLSQAGAMDMFPQTSHVEAMAVLERQ